MQVSYCTLNYDSIQIYFNNVQSILDDRSLLVYIKHIGDKIPPIDVCGKPHQQLSIDSIIFHVQINFLVFFPLQQLDSAQQEPVSSLRSNLLKTKHSLAITMQ